jgi:hypothetical protein
MTQDEDQSKESIEDLTGSSEPDDGMCIWLGMELIIPDKNGQHNPYEMEDNIRDWVSTFLERGLQNIDYDETGEGVDLFPRADDWESNTLYLRYKKEAWFDDPDDVIGRRREFDVWFPVRDFMEHHELDALKEKSTYLIGDEVYEQYGEELNVRGILLAGSEMSVRDHIENTIPDVEFDNYV